MLPGTQTSKSQVVVAGARWGIDPELQRRVCVWWWWCGVCVWGEVGKPGTALPAQDLDLCILRRMIKMEARWLMSANKRIGFILGGGGGGGGGMRKKTDLEQPHLLQHFLF